MSTPIRLAIATLSFAAWLEAQVNAQSFGVRDPDLGHLLSGGVAFATNESKVLAGFGLSPASGWGQAIRFDSGGAFVLPALLGDDAGTAYGINEVGTIVGTSTDIIQQHQLTLFFDRAVKWENAQVIELASLVTTGPTLELQGATAINDVGTIVGVARDAGQFQLRAFKLEGGTLTDLGALAATPSQGSSANAIDPYGNVVGRSTANGGFDHAVAWQNGQLIDLHAAANIPGRVSEAFDINRFGVIVGAADFVADFLDYKVATVWKNGQATNLGTLGGPGSQAVIESFARAINDLGVIVGTSVTPSFEVHACIWRDGVITDLNTLIPPGTGWILANAHDIANDGRIVGEGFFGGGLRPFVLTPKCDGSYLVYGTACAAGSVTPSLAGFGCPSPDQPFALEIKGGTPNGGAMLFLGSGTGTAAVSPTCSLQTFPLYPLALPVTFDSLGVAFLNAELPVGTPSFDIWVQSLFAHPGAPFGVAGTQPIKLHFQ
jgi:probable HAF family extracellular repeat protein